MTAGGKFDLPLHERVAALEAKEQTGSEAIRRIERKLDGLILLIVAGFFGALAKWIHG
jgi:hypothetical protein